MLDAQRPPVLIATDLTEDAEIALMRGRAIAHAVGAPWVVVHVVPDVLRHHPLVPSRDENDAILALDLAKQTAELVTQQVSRVLRVSADHYRVRIELGDAEDEIVRVAEEERAQLIVVGAKPRHGRDPVLGHVAERVVRYGHAPVLVARAGEHTRRLLLATDFTEGALPALELAARLVDRAGANVTLIHVMPWPKSTALVPASSAFGSPWMPPSTPAIEQLEALGLAMLESLAEQYHFHSFEQLEGDPAEGIIRRADEIAADTIVMGSHGRTGLQRLVLGSVAERVIRESTRSVLVVRAV